jgi:hypothetical protein
MVFRKDPTWTINQIQDTFPEAISEAQRLCLKEGDELLVGLLIYSVKFGPPTDVSSSMGKVQHMPNLLLVEISEQEMRLLSMLARFERRDPHQQAALFITRQLQTELGTKRRGRRRVAKQGGADAISAPHECASAALAG